MSKRRKLSSTKSAIVPRSVLKMVGVAAVVPAVAIAGCGSGRNAPDSGVVGVAMVVDSGRRDGGHFSVADAGIRVDAGRDGGRPVDGGHFSVADAGFRGDGSIFGVALPFDGDIFGVAIPFDGDIFGVALPPPDGGA